MISELRTFALQDWLSAVLPAPLAWQPMTPGAGRRRYFRVTDAQARSWVVMDAPADAKCAAFLKLAQAFRAVGVQTPVVQAADLQQGFLLLTDLGCDLYGDLLNAQNADALYQSAFTALLRIQSYAGTADSPLLEFDWVHYREKMTWFIEFFCQRYLNLSLTPRQHADCHRVFDLLLESGDAQPKTCVHYDYHCRNLLRLPDGQAGVLDFQDAVRGPIAYDIVSLLRDCYIDWPVVRVREWLRQYQQVALNAGVLRDEDPALWLRWCDFSGLQRHLKCVGLFTRFHVIGHTSDYLVYLPRLLNYLREVSARYLQTRPLYELLEKIFI